jgi:hypothetical protein
MPSPTSLMLISRLKAANARLVEPEGDSPDESLTCCWCVVMSLIDNSQTLNGIVEHVMPL